MGLFSKHYSQMNKEERARFERAEHAKLDAVLAKAQAMAKELSYLSLRVVTPYDRAIGKIEDARRIMWKHLKIV